MLLLALISGILHPSIDAPIAEPKKEQTLLPLADSSWRTPARGARVFLIGDFLYWTANEEELDVAYKAKGESGQLPLSDVKIAEFDQEFNTGFRVGLGYRFPHDQWEVKGYVTQFRTTNHLDKHAENGTFIQPNFGALESFQEMHGNWHLKYTLLDIALCRYFPMSKAVGFSPFLGARAAWLSQTLHVKCTEPVSSSSSLQLHGKNKYHAAGLRLGADLYFYLMKYVSLFGEASFSLLSGRFDLETKVNTHTASTDSTLFSNENKPHRLTSCCELRGGVLGTLPLYRREAFFTLGLTYDMALWFSQNQWIDFFSGGGAVQTQQNHGNLMLQGVAFTTRLDF